MFICVPAASKRGFLALDMGNEIGVSAVMNFVINSRAESVAIGVGNGGRSAMGLVLVTEGSAVGNSGSSKRSLSDGEVGGRRRGL